MRYDGRCFDFITSSILPFTSSILLKLSSFYPVIAGMRDIAKRFPENPLLSPKDLKATTDGLHIACLLNPGVFQFQGKTWLLVRVAERPEQDKVVVSFPILTATGETQIMKIALDDADLIATDARVVRYKGVD